MESILDTIKKMLGIDTEDVSFDLDIITLINPIIYTLAQMGIGPSTGFIVVDKNNTWNEYIGSSLFNLEGVKTYIYLKTKLIFDPPTNTTTIDAMTRNAQELEWRMMLEVETNNLEG